MLYPTLIYKAFYKFSHLNIHLSLFLGGHHLCVSVCPCGHLSVPKIVCFSVPPGDWDTVEHHNLLHDSVFFTVQSLCFYDFVVK